MVEKASLKVLTAVLLQIQFFKDAAPYRRESCYRSKVGELCLHCVYLQTNCSHLVPAGKCTDLEGPEGEKRYSYTLSLTLALDGGRWSKPRHAPDVLLPGKRPSTHYR